MCLETISVNIMDFQVLKAYFKTEPVRFELLGWTDSRVIVRFGIITVTLVLLIVATLNYVE